jgi:peroxiredoxin
METQSAPSLALGKTAPLLFAQNPGGKSIPIHDGKAKWTVVAFLSTRCPCTARYLTRLNTLLQQFDRRSVRLVGVNSNANELPEDAVAFARSQKLRFPLLKDNDGSVARALHPRATPEIFILDAQRRVRYHGAIDDSVDGDNIHRFYLRDALTRLTSGKSLPVPETNAIGCAIFLHKK